MRMDGIAYETWSGALTPVYVRNGEIYVGDPYGGADLRIEDAPEGELIMV